MADCFEFASDKLKNVASNSFTHHHSRYHMLLVLDLRMSSMSLPCRCCAMLCNLFLCESCKTPATGMTITHEPFGQHTVTGSCRNPVTTRVHVECKHVIYIYLYYIKYIYIYIWLTMYQYMYIFVTVYSLPAFDSWTYHLCSRKCFMNRVSCHKNCP